MFIISKTSKHKKIIYLLAICINRIFILNQKIFQKIDHFKYLQRIICQNYQTEDLIIIKISNDIFVVHF